MVPKKRISPSVSQARAEISCKTDDTLMPLHLAARSLGTLVDPRGALGLVGGWVYTVDNVGNPGCHKQLPFGEGLCLPPLKMVIVGTVHGIG